MRVVPACVEEIYQFVKDCDDSLPGSSDLVIPVKSKMTFRAFGKDFKAYFGPDYQPAYVAILHNPSREFGSQYIAGKDFGAALDLWREELERDGQRIIICRPR